MMIEAKTNITTPPFRYAVETAQMWFPNVEARDDVCVIHLSATDLAEQDVRERVISICGNTPGLADALIANLEEIHPDASAGYAIRLVIQRDDNAAMPFNHPGENAERVRHALP